MGDETKTIFRVMNDLNYNLIVKGEIEKHKFSDTTKKAFLFVEEYFRSGALGTSEKMKFILKNYAFDKVSIAATWNITHSDKLTANAIRIQEFRLNKTFISIFGLPEVIENAFMSEDMEVVSSICDKIRVLKQGDVSIDTYFTKDLLLELIKGCGVYKADNLKISDCSPELEFLCRVSNLNILDTAEQLNIDRNKLAYVISVLSQPMIKKNNTGLNSEKFELVTRLHKNLKNNPLERIIETKEFLSTQQLDKSIQEVDYQQMYMDLLKKYNDLQNTMKLQEESGFVSASSLVSNLFSEDIAIPNAVMDIVNDIASEYDGDKVLRMDDAKDFGDTLFALTKYAMPIIVKDIASLDEKMLYCIWAALHDKLEVENSNKKDTQNMIEQFKGVMLERVDLLRESEYVSQIKQLLDGIVKETKGVSENE